MTTDELIRAVGGIAPAHLAEPWDNTGLLVGDPNAGLTGPILLTIDLTDDVLAEAIRLDAGAIISYHPPIFSAVKSLTTASREGRIVLACAARGIAVYSPHTALDAAPRGLAEWLVSLADPEADASTAMPITPHVRTDPEQSHKIITFHIFLRDL